jgi:hypothetical protein
VGGDLGIQGRGEKHKLLLRENLEKHYLKKSSPSDARKRLAIRASAK